MTPPHQGPVQSQFQRWFHLLGLVLVLLYVLSKEHEAISSLQMRTLAIEEASDENTTSSLKEFDAWHKLSSMSEFSEDAADDDAIAPSTNEGDFACQWGPGQDDPCVETVSRQIKASLARLNAPPLHHHRYLLLGDSTTAMLWGRSPIGQTLTKDAKIHALCPHYDCPGVWAGRCDIDGPLQIPRPESWTSPNYTIAEGPVHNGKNNHFCHDCAGCNSMVLSCTKKADADASATCPPDDTTRQALYGGFIAIEFARDVEFQSTEFVTTQESVLHYYIDKVWNTDDLVAEFGRPICIVGNGFHDMAIPSVTLDLYLDSVEWYTKRLLTSCDHIVWLGNNSPQTDNFEQKRNMTLEWNHGVRDLLMAHERTSFIDVYNASLDHSRRDNLHMSADWYFLVGSMFLQIFAS